MLWFQVDPVMAAFALAADKEKDLEDLDGKGVGRGPCMFIY